MRNIEMGLILVIVLILILLGGFGGPYVGAPWPHAYGLGTGPVSLVGVVLVILVVLLLLGRI
jgi:Protein of unknown function (DUF3309)